MILYSYWRSSAAYRVRIALNYKKLDHQIKPLSLINDGGEQQQREYRALNPQGLIPTLVDGDRVITQSLAIIEYLEERYPAPPLLPEDSGARARARQIANTICMDIHPLNNLRVLKYLERELNVNKASREKWYWHWITEGFKALEVMLSSQSGKGPYCLGEAVTIADLCLIPQMYNAHRFNVPLKDFPTLLAIEEASLTLAAFKAAQPEQQPDA